jgi:hypothetical protein
MQFGAPPLCAITGSRFNFGQIAIEKIMKCLENSLKSERKYTENISTTLQGPPVYDAARSVDVLEEIVDVLGSVYG